MEHDKRTLLINIVTAVAGGIVTFFFISLGGERGPLLWVIPVVIIISWTLISLLQYRRKPKGSAAKN
jgi:hypothetical protein